MKKQIVFLGGTCNNSLWRESLIPLLKIDYYNPVVKGWTPECQAEEIRQREECDFCLYVITPRMTGVFSIAEVADDSNKRPNKTIFCYLPQDVITDSVSTFTAVQLKSLKAVASLVEGNGAKVFVSLEDVANYLNNAK